MLRGNNINLFAIDLNLVPKEISGLVVHLPQAKGSDHVSRAGDNNRRENRRHHHVQLRPLEHMSRKTYNLRRYVERNPNGSLRRARPREGRSRRDRRQERQLRRERRHGDGDREDRRPRRGVHQERPPQGEALEYRIEERESHLKHGKSATKNIRCLSSLI